MVTREVKSSDPCHYDPSLLQHFFVCEVAPLYFFVFYDSVLFHDFFVLALLGGKQVTVGRDD